MKTINFVDTGKGVTMQINSGVMKAIKSDPSLQVIDSNTLLICGVEIHQDDTVKINGVTITGSTFDWFNTLEPLFPKSNTGSAGSGPSETSHPADSLDSNDVNILRQIIATYEP